jgi:predicted permease
LRPAAVLPPVEQLLDIVLPVFLLIAAGFGACRVGLVEGEAAQRVANLVFVLLMGPLLFRSMARAELGSVSFAPTLAYYGASLAMFAAVLATQTALLGRGRAEAAMRALTATFSNTAMVGIPIVTLAFGEAGLALLMPIIALHALVLLTLATVVIELDRARRPVPADAGAASAPIASSPWRATGRAAFRSIVHPVVSPVLIGLAWHALDWPLSGPIDRTLQLLGSAGPTMSLLLMGASLAHAGLARSWRGALGSSLLKAFAHPLAVWAVGAGLLGLRGLPLAVAVVAGALPVGGNVYLLSQRYGLEVAGCRRRSRCRRCCRWSRWPPSSTCSRPRKLARRPARRPRGRPSATPDAASPEPRAEAPSPEAPSRPAPNPPASQPRAPCPASTTSPPAPPRFPSRCCAKSPTSCSTGAAAACR